MKKIYLLASILCFGLYAQAQTTAKDWTKSDCGNNQSINLFNVLDGGTIVIQEYVMMNCSPCVTAGNGLKTILQQYESSHPGRVKIFQTSYDNSTSCQDMKDWANTANFTNSTLFTVGASEVSYYGGMGMPTIAVLGGGNQHKVYYKKQGYSPSENANIKAAIDMALSETSTGISDVNSNVKVSLYPNPSANELILESKENIAKIEVIGVDGRVQLTVAGPVTRIDISSLHVGIYFIRISDDAGKTGIKKFVKL